MVTAARTLLKPEPLKAVPQFVEIDVRIRLAFQNPKSKLLILAHAQ